MSLWDIIGLAVQSAMGTAQTAVNVTANRRAFKWSQKYHDEVTLPDWERQNEYNLPENQMARYEAAGLNPNLVYGNAASSESAHIDSGSFNARDINLPNFADALSTYFTARNLELNQQRTDAQTDLINTRIQEITDTLGPKVEKMLADAISAKHKADNSGQFYSEQARALKLSNAIKDIQIDSGFHQLQTEFLRTKKNYMDTQTSYMQTARQFLTERINFQKWYNELEKAFGWETRSLDNELKRQGISMYKVNRAKGIQDYKTKKLQNKWFNKYDELGQNPFSNYGSLANVLYHGGVMGISNFLNQLLNH